MLSLLREQNRSRKSNLYETIGFNSGLGVICPEFIKTFEKLRNNLTPNIPSLENICEDHKQLFPHRVDHRRSNFTSHWVTGNRTSGCKCSDLCLCLCDSGNCECKCQCKCIRVDECQCKCKIGSKKIKRSPLFAYTNAKRLNDFWNSKYLIPYLSVSESISRLNNNFQTKNGEYFLIRLSTSQPGHLTVSFMDSNFSGVRHVRLALDDNGLIEITDDECVNTLSELAAFFQERYTGRIAKPVLYVNF